MKPFILTLLFTVSVLFVQAQLVNIENMRKGNKEGFQGGISLSLDLKQNTKQIFQTVNTVDFQYKRKVG